ncbi:MAG: outer membrane lipoprotein-sorting protein [Prosthecobacter sp.]|uniref:outer membrane lipoprotein-sorting protein n=1 Tax=Prosthecobacter sp. TaxID=1965333 RepID=UPI0025D773B8|nr:outer membrane lipoprotein-sorting protein [Prosthecobacter sp.]MCF7786903.1 outer membrane lipoprotein-sorting protein [Prosthecobacter sp.]
MKTLLWLICTALLAVSALADDSASDLAAKLGALQQNGASVVRLKMEVQGTAKSTLQLQIKQRRTRASTEVVYLVLWPKERAGEAVLLRKTGDQSASGATFTPPNTVRTLDSSQMKESLLGSDLTYDDVVENFFLWKQQAIIGTEIVNRVSCDILESKPGSGQHSSYASVRTWVDRRRDVPLRVEKYSASGQLVRRIETTRVVTNDNKQAVPANLTVNGPRQGSVTELNGSSIKHGVSFSDREFTPAGFMEVTPARSASN